MFKRLFSGSRMTRECHVRFCEKFSGFAGRFTHHTKHANFAFLLLLMGILPAMGMNNQNASKWLGISIDEQKKLFNDFDIQKIAETDIDKGILLEQHLKDIGTITSTIASKNSFPTIETILNDTIDKQQKMMGLIECAHFISSPILPKLIQYALVKDMIPKKMLEGSDTTIKTFYQIKNVIDAKPQQTLKLVKEILPTIENIKEYPLDQNFDPITNDIKTIKYKYDEEILGVTDALSAFEVVDIPNSPSQITVNSGKLKLQDERTKIIREIFNGTSLSNKIALILRLYDLNKLVSKNINSIKESTLTLTTFRDWAIVGAFFGLFNFPFLLHFANEIEKNPAITDYVALKNAALPKKDLVKTAALVSVTFGTFIGTFDNIINPLINSMPINLSNACTISATNSAIIFLIASPFYFPLVCLLPHIGLCALYFLDQLEHQKELREMKKEQKNIQNLIEEFKESVKQEYKH